MRILGIDTSGKVAAAALYDTEAQCLLGQQVVYTKRTHSQVILPLAERLLADTGLTFRFPVPEFLRWKVWPGRIWPGTALYAA